MPRCMREVFVRREQGQAVANAELGEQGVDGAELNTRLAADVAQARRLDVVLSIGLNQRQGCEALDDPGPIPGARESLQELLQDQARGDDHLGTEQRLLQLVHLGTRRFDVPAQSQGPDARVDQESHWRRDRSAL